MSNNFRTSLNRKRKYLLEKQLKCMLNDSYFTVTDIEYSMDYLKYSPALCIYVDMCKWQMELLTGTITTCLFHSFGVWFLGRFGNLDSLNILTEAFPLIYRKYMTYHDKDLKTTDE